MDKKFYIKPLIQVIQDLNRKEDIIIKKRRDEEIKKGCEARREEGLALCKEWGGNSLPLLLFRFI